MVARKNFKDKNEKAHALVTACFAIVTLFLSDFEFGPWFIFAGLPIAILGLSSYFSMNFLFQEKFGKWLATLVLPLASLITSLLVFLIILTTFWPEHRTEYYPIELIFVSFLYIIPLLSIPVSYGISLYLRVRK